MTSETETFATDAFLAERYGVVRESIWAWTRTGKFPKAVRLTRGCTRWKMSEVLAWEAERAAAAS